VDDFLLGAVSALFGLYLIVRRKQFAARTVRQQNWFWRMNYGSRQIRHNERAAIVIGVFALFLAVMFWSDSRMSSSVGKATGQATDGAGVYSEGLTKRRSGVGWRHARMRVGSTRSPDDGFSTG